MRQLIIFGAGANECDTAASRSPNKKVANPFEFATLCLGVCHCSVWAKGDLNPHVPKDTGT
jgi:hypothetical protein